MATLSIPNVASALLATAQARLRIAAQSTQPLRALCDSGAQLNLISECAVQKERLPTQECRVQVYGIGNGTPVIFNRKVVAQIMSRFDDTPLVTAELLVSSKITTCTLPLEEISTFPVPSSIESRLADPMFRTPAPVDLLLGAGVWAGTLREGLQTGDLGVVAQNTGLGWIVFGGAVLINKELSRFAGHLATTSDPLEPLIRRFFEFEEPTKRARTIEQEQCEQFFIQHHTRDIDGRYVVGIPLRSDVVSLGSSRAIALRRFYQLEQRLDRDSDLRAKYEAAIEDLICLRHLVMVDRPPTGMCYHIPHHCVKTKFRVVFDASCPTNEGISLNEAQLVGEKLQEDLADILMRFRMNQIAVSADIKQMFRQVRVRQEDWDLQRMFWRANRQTPPKEYWLTVVTFGLSSAPHCAVRAMQQAAIDQKEQFAMAATAVLEDFYMDDLLTGAANVEDALIKCQQIDELLKNAGFVLDKWVSNRPSVLPSHVNRAAMDVELNLDGKDETTILGLRWLTKTDELTFKVRAKKSISADKLTKRNLVSAVAQVYDPNGFLGPSVIIAKILVSDLWRFKTSWDELVPPEIQQRWRVFEQQLPLLAEIRLPRWLNCTPKDIISLHGFADASQKAYGAAVYLRVERGSASTSVLLASKSRVAPCRTVTIPRLELTAARLLVDLIEQVRHACRLDETKAILWSDSAVALHWINGGSDRLKLFVHNRVEHIKWKMNNCDWRHVSSDDNPADIISRGLLPEKLAEADLWWHGPPWLIQPSNAWPVSRVQLTTSCREQIRAEIKTKFDDEGLCASLKTIQKGWMHTLQIESDKVSLLYRCSSLMRLLRVTAWIKRFVHNSRQSSKNRTIDLRRCGPLEEDEIETALRYWIVLEQQTFYAKEREMLRPEPDEQKPKTTIQKSSQLIKLAPFMDGEILRVGGRLANANVAYDQRCPMILPSVSRLATLLVHFAHQETLHGSEKQIIGWLAQRFWIIGVRQLVHTNRSRCLECTIQAQKLSNQIMGDLPAERVRFCRPFRHVGIDYAGPMSIKSWAGRCKTFYKVYVAIFVCMATKAIHLELVESLSTEAFIAAFTRFTSIRGAVSCVWSDNGTNFVGAAKELKRMIDSWQGNDFYDRIAKFHVTWKFITPAASHQGGLWESAVKSMKYHLRRVVGDQILSMVGMQTYLAQISAVLNSRPMTAMTQDPTDLDYLTPAHFLIGESIMQPFGSNVEDIPDNRLQYYQRIQKMSQHFARRWNSDYLHELQQRPKWRQERANLKVGDMVIIRHEHIPPNMWDMGRIVATHPGADGRVRNVTVKTATSELRRPIQKLVLLPCENIEAPERFKGAANVRTSNSQNDGNDN